MKLDGKLIAKMAAILVVLPILYVASSGPALLLASKRQDQGVTYRRVLRFYRPELRAAYALHLQSPLSWYLRLWKLRPFWIRVAGKTGTAQASLRDGLGPAPIVAPPIRSSDSPRPTPAW